MSETWVPNAKDFCSTRLRFRGNRGEASPKPPAAPRVSAIKRRRFTGVASTLQTRKFYVHAPFAVSVVEVGLEDLISRHQTVQANSRNERKPPSPAIALQVL